MNKAPVRVGIIGCGGVSLLYHARSILGRAPKAKKRVPPDDGLLRKGRRFVGRRGRQLARRLLRGRKQATHMTIPPGIEGAEITAVADIDSERLASFCDAFDLRQVYSGKDYKELLARTDVDAVLVCTPQSSHAEIVVAAARQGKHIFCEKPMAMTSEECLRMIEATDKANVVLQIGYVLRFSSEHGRIREAILNGEIGRPVFLQNIMSLRAGSPQRWVHDQQLGGGVLWEYSHGPDFLRYIFGDPDLVFAVGGRYKPDNTSALDTIAVSLTFPSGDKALFADSYALRGFGWDKIGCRPNRLEVDVVGPRGVVQYPDADRSRRLTIRVYGDPEDRVEKTPEWTSPWGANGYRQELEHFIECVRTGKQPAVPGQEGLRTIQLLEAIMQSVRTGDVCRFAGSR